MISRIELFRLCDPRGIVIDSTPYAAIEDCSSSTRGSRRDCGDTKEFDFLTTNGRLFISDDRLYIARPYNGSLAPLRVVFYHFNICDSSFCTEYINIAHEFESCKRQYHIESKRESLIRNLICKCNVLIDTYKKNKMAKYYAKLLLAEMIDIAKTLNIPYKDVL